MLLVCVATLSSAWASAKDVSIQFDIQPRALRVGEAAVGSLTVRGVANPPVPNFPPVDGLQINLVGTERSFSLGSGGADAAFIFRYRVVPLRAGKFQIGPFTYQVEQHSVDLPAIQLHVVDPNAQTTDEPSPESLLFAVLEIFPTNLFSQQVFELALRVYAADGINLGRDISLLNLPSAGLGFQPFHELGTERTVHNNRVYNVRRFTTKATALTSGSFTIAPTVRVQVIIPRERRRPRDPFFDGFDSIFDEFFGRVSVQDVDLSVPAVALNVQPLPEQNRPPTFGGAVGRFDFQAEVKPLECTAGDPITINYTIAGEGNIENVGPPVFKPDDRWRVYEPKLVTKDIRAAQATGRIIFEQVAIPKEAGEIELPVLEFSYFDPVQGEYRTLRRGPFAVRVHPSTNITGKIVQAPARTTPTSPQIIGTDIVYLKAAPRHWHSQKRPAFYRRRIFWITQSIPFVLSLLIGMLQRRRHRLETDTAWVRRTRAPRAARTGLRLAERAWKESQRNAFFEAVYKTLGDYFGDRFNLPPGAITSAEILARLRTAGFEDKFCAALEDIYRRCEETRFAGPKAETMSAAERADARELLRKVEETLQACERLKL